MEYELFKSDREDYWIVEGINFAGEGEVTWAEFYGSGAEKRARDYLEWVRKDSH